jgi:hypothetical protein
MNVEIGTVTARFLFWDNFFWIFGIGSLQCGWQRIGIGWKENLIDNDLEYDLEDVFRQKWRLWCLCNEPVVLLYICTLKGSLTRDFGLQVFFMNHCPPGPQVFHGGRFEFFRKFAEIFDIECSSPVNDTGDKLFTGVNDTADKFIAGVVDTGDKFPWHGFSVIVGVVDTGDKFLTGVNDNGEQLSPVTKTLAINLLPVTRTRTPWRWGAANDRRKLKGTNL